MLSPCSQRRRSLHVIENTRCVAWQTFRSSMQATELFSPAICILCRLLVLVVLQSFPICTVARRRALHCRFRLIRCAVPCEQAVHGPKLASALAAAGRRALAGSEIACDASALSRNKRLTVLCLANVAGASPALKFPHARHLTDQSPCCLPRHCFTDAHLRCYSLVRQPPI